MARASYSTTPLLRSLVHRPQGVILVAVSQGKLNIRPCNWGGSVCIVYNCQERKYMQNLWKLYYVLWTQYHSRASFLSVVCITRLSRHLTTFEHHSSALTPTARPLDNPLSAQHALERAAWAISASGFPQTSQNSSSRKQQQHQKQ